MGTLVNQLLLVGVPNEGTLFAYIYRNIPGFEPYGYLAHTPAAQAMLPTFPYWRGSTADAWSLPPDDANPVLAELNRRPMPSGVHVEVFYGSAQRTLTGVTNNGAPTLGPGDGIVPAASAEGLPIQGGSGVPALLAPNVVHVDLGAVGHMQLLLDVVVDRSRQPSSGASTTARRRPLASPRGSECCAPRRRLPDSRTRNDEHGMAGKHRRKRGGRNLCAHPWFRCYS